MLAGDMVAIEDSLQGPAVAHDSATLGVSGTAGFVYHVQASQDLILWSQIGDVTIPSSGFTNFFDTDVTNFPYRFYRTLHP